MDKTVEINWTADLTFKRLREYNVKRCNEYIRLLDSWEPMIWGGCCAGELGEFLNLAKKIKRGDIGITKEDLAKELADTLVYLDLTAASLGIDLGQAVIDKFNEVSDRWNSPIKL